jgi:hypothetical protein
MRKDRASRAAPGMRLLRWAERRCGREVLESVVRPTIADLQFEDAAGSQSGLVSLFLRLRAYLALARALAVHAVTREMAPTEAQSENSMKVVPIIAGVLAVSVSAMASMGLVFQDPHPALLLVIGVVLIALGVSRPVPRWLPRLVAFWGFVLAASTLYLFRDSDYQGTGSLILMPVFGGYAAMSFSPRSIAILAGPALIAAGVIVRMQGRADHGLLIATGVLLTLFALACRHARWRAPIMKVARLLQLAGLALAVVLLLRGHKDVAWDGLIANSSFSLLAGFGSPERDVRSRGSMLGLRT